LLKIFEWGRWQVKPEELELLKPSIQLASNLVRVAIPYIATFLPPRDDIFKDGNFFDENGERANLCPTEIPLKQNPSEDEVAAALDALEKFAPSIRWQTNYEMWASPAAGEGKEAMEWMGVTRLVDEERPWGVVSPEEIEASDAELMKTGLDHRPLVIGIMGEYVNAIRNSPKTSEQHLRATFMAGITMAHEVGHAIFHHDFRSYNPPALDEPYVGNGCSRELGIAFITWIFDGFHPNGTELHGHSLVDFTAHLSWVQHYTVDIDRRPLYKTSHSISVRYIQEKLTQSWWDGLPSPPELIDFSSKAKEKLKPITDPSSSEAATARHPEWIYSWLNGRPQWKSDWDFRKPGYRLTDKVEGVSDEELDWQKARQQIKGWEAVLAAKTPSELKEIQRRYAKGVDDDSDEKEFFKPWPVVEDADIGGLDIEDGIIEKDVIAPLEDETTPLTRIVVRYLPDEETSAKHPRDDTDDDDDGDHDERSVKRARLGSQPHDYGGSGDGQPETEVDKFLDRSSPFTIATTMTRIDIYNICVQRKIPSFSNLEASEGWQRGHPDLEDPTDNAAVQRLYNDMLATAETTLFANDTQARLKLRRASLMSVRYWSMQHLQDFCHANGVPSHCTIEQVRRRLRNWMRGEIEKVRHGYSADSPPSKEYHAVEKATNEKAAANPENWPLNELQIFCRQNDIPEAGTKTSLIIKIKRYLKYQARGRRIQRRPQRARTDANGFEVYAFKAILGQSTVAALKSALFIMGNFAPEAILTLYFKTDYGFPLKDDQPLSKYSLSNWKTLRLKVARSSRFGPGSTADNPIDIDAKPVVHFNDPIPLPGSTITSAIEIPDFSIITIDDEPTPAEVLRAGKEDPAVQREVAVVVNGANPTFSELLSSVGNRALSLDRFVQAGGRFADRKNPQPATSGLSILGEIEDHLEDEENKEKNLKALMGAPDSLPGKHGDRYPPMGTSHMADTFHAMNKKHVPPKEEEE
jgi:hypothetical protein